MQEVVVQNQDICTEKKEKGKWNIPDFDLVNQDPEESSGIDPAMKALFHQLGYLDRSDFIMNKPAMDSRLWLGRCCKKIIYKLCMFMLEPLIKQQNEINLQVASFLRTQLHQVNQLTKTVQELTERCEGLSVSDETVTEGKEI